MFCRRAFQATRTLLLGSVLVLAACSTTGNSFDTTDLRFLLPGETTLQEATLLLQGEPVNVYRQLDGSAMARWAHTATLATDAVYFNQELWLAFDSYGRFQRIIKSNNVPQANLYNDGRRVDAPLPHASLSGHVPAVQGVWSAPATPGIQEARSVPASQSVASPPSVSGSGAATSHSPGSLPPTAVSYPLNR